MTNAVQYVTEVETLELRFLRLPHNINSKTMPQIMADLDELLEPGIGVMLDFSRTTTVELTCLKVFELAANLAIERASSLGYMGEADGIKPILHQSPFFSK